MRNYMCSKCSEVVKRKSEKKWIKSWCSNTEQFSRLMIMPTNSRKKLSNGLSTNKLAKIVNSIWPDKPNKHIDNG